MKYVMVAWTEKGAGSAYARTPEGKDAKYERDFKILEIKENAKEARRKVKGREAKAKITRKAKAQIQKIKDKFQKEAIKFLKSRDKVKDKEKKAKNKRREDVRKAFRNM